MSTTIERAVLSVGLALVAGHGWAADENARAFAFGTTPSPEELSKFVSPLPDGRGLPPGSGSVAQGKEVYEQQCVACHGQNLQGGLGDRLIGGRGTLVNGDPAKPPVKTVESYWPYATTLFDYVKRAMPLAAPGSLTNDQVYAVSAYILSEAKIVPGDTVLDGKSLAKVAMPNRDGFIPDPRPEKFPPAARTPHQDRRMATTSK
jgi:S-disulfanyl-L-cysteine oxidoreductase SoxD